MSKAQKGDWCGSPNHSNMRELDDLFKVGARCDAWRSFLKSKTVAALRQIKGHVIWFNRYEHFETLICEFDCTESKLTAVIKGLMLPKSREIVEFVRRDIYDARAWAYLPLGCFTKTTGFNKRTDTERMQYDVLALNEMPIVQFGIRKPWVVTRDCFTLRHRIKDGGRFAEMTFAHPQLDTRFRNLRWVADGMFPREAKRADIEAVLFAKVREEAANYLVSIT